jgi:hypothetical protein
MDPVMMMLLAMSQSGGGDPSSAYLDPVMAYLSGSYTPERRWSDEELMSIYAPTLMRYLQNTEGKGDFYDAAQMISQGQTPYEIASSKDKLDDKPYMQLLEQLQEEQSKLLQQKLSRDSRKDQFEEMGLPGYGKGYSNDQLINMFPQAFADIAPRLAGAQANTARLAKKMEAERAAFLKEAQEAPVIPRASASGADFNKYVADYKDYKKGVKNTKAFDTTQKARMDQQRYTPGGEGYEALKAQMRMELARGALEAEGRSPLSDALISSAMLKRVLGR